MLLTKKLFKKYINDVAYFYRFAKNDIWYEIYFEPCDQGFEISLYQLYGVTTHRQKLVKPRLCTVEEGYEKDYLNEIERSDQTWITALLIANQAFADYFN